MASCKVIAIIPARGGSKSVPNKNIRVLKGKPLIQYSIDCALQSKLIDRVIVTTDSPAIAKIAAGLGAEVPFLRPASISGDRARDISYVQHLLKWLRRNGEQGRLLFVLLRPTEPYREPEVVDSAIQLLQENPGAHSVRSVAIAEQTPFKMWRMRGKRLVPLIAGANGGEPYNMPRQELPRVYWQNGYVDAFWDTTVSRLNSITGSKVLAFLTDVPTTNIDTLDDLEKARRHQSPKKKAQAEPRYSS
jgi:N-acylneuraminate cytidylyltransferase